MVSEQEPLQQKVVRHKGDTLTPAELRKILERTMVKAIGAKPDDLMKLILIRVLAVTGRRIGEVLKIRRRDVNLEDRLLKTRIEKRGDNQERMVSFDEDTAKLFESYFSLRKLKPDDLVFKITRRHASRVIQKFVKEECGIDKWVPPHAFRHSLITYLRSLGWNDLDIIKVTGHSNPNSLRNYDHTTFFTVKNRFEDAMKKLAEGDR